ncbi:MAG TPA: HD domain-containing phosphohydrolase [Terriglobales bacterium]|nr:HD domain-containing phosphohydrolase [Terriglobales bacterium]
MNWKARIFVAVTATAGFVIAASTFSHWQSSDPVRFFFYFLIAMLASGMKVTLPGINGTMSVNFLFILIGLLDMSYPETMALGCAATLVQSFYGSWKRVKPVHVIFNVFSMMCTAIAVSHFVYTKAAIIFHGSTQLMLISAATAYFLANTIPVTAIISLTEEKSFKQLWLECYFWSFPYYLVGAGIAGAISFSSRYVGWQTALLVLPIVYWIYRSYRVYLGRLEDERRHVEQMAALHLRTIEALALAIEAKDHTTHDHLQRVTVYALEIGKEMGLSSDEIEALRAAALLHDIGKLAVPEHIINKPGKLTAEEFEKMKIHPLVGAEILERVSFPYPVVPIVLAHHEKWDGSGYPNGLRGKEIPIGARILSAVDCFDALASDRQYRKALPLTDAMQIIRFHAGSQFDPDVVDVLSRRYLDLEALTQSQEKQSLQRLSTNIMVPRGSAPAAGLDQSTAGEDTLSGDAGFLSSIAAARQEAQMLYELSHDLGNSLSLDETLSVFSVRLKKLVPYDSAVIYICREDRLIPMYATGDNARVLSAMEIPLGNGVSGWVAQNRKPLINGDPTREPGTVGDDIRLGALRSALSVPLCGLDQKIFGVLTLYRSEQEAFTRDHLRILLAISAKVALSIENAQRYQQAKDSAVTDFLTGLPNARSLYLHLNRELARCSRDGLSLALMVCDLDGFKQVNDRFGHQHGDKVLRQFAGKLMLNFREYDYVARMGGDEFVMIVPSLTESHVKQKAALISRLATEAGREITGVDLISASVGTAFFGSDGSDAEKLLATADQRMYMLKHEQRERSKKLGQISLTPESSLTVN